MNARREIARRLATTLAGALLACGCVPVGPPIGSPPSAAEIDAEQGDDVIPAPTQTVSGPTAERQQQWMIACEPPPPPPPPPPGAKPDPRERERYSTLVRQFREAVGVEPACDPAPWLRRQAAYPDIEGLYCVLSVAYDVCEQPEEALAWARERAEHFPDHAQAWFALAARRFDALWPVPGSSVPFNETRTGAERYALANAVISDLQRAIGLDPNQRDPWVYLAMAFTQRQLARAVLPRPRSEREQLDALLYEEDAHLANEAVREICRLDAMPECKGQPRPDCCPRPLFTPAQVEALSAEKKRLLERLGTEALSTPTLMD